MANNITIRGGSVVNRPGGRLKMALDNTGINNATYGATVLKVQQRDEAGTGWDVWLDMKSVPGGMVAGYVTVRSYSSVEDIRETLFPLDGPFTPAVALIPLGTSLGIVAEPNAAAYIIPINAAGVWGRPSVEIPIEQITDVSDDVDVTLVTPPTLTGNQTKGADVTGFVAGSYTGENNDETPLTVITRRLQDSADGTTGWANIGAANDTKWPTTTRAKLRIQESVTGRGLGSALVTNTTPAVDAVDPPTALPVPSYTLDGSVQIYDNTEDWCTAQFTVSNLPGGGWIEWTTDTNAEPPDNKIEKTSAATTTVSGLIRIQMMDPLKRTDPTGQSQAARQNYAVFKYDPATGNINEQNDRHQKLRIRYATSTQIGPFTPAFTVPNMDGSVDPIPSTDWAYMVTRVTQSKGSYPSLTPNTPYITGPGQQFLRSIAVTDDDPDLLIGAMDENTIWASDDFGGHFYTPPMVGGWGMRTGDSIWADPTNANHWLISYYSSLVGTNTKGAETDGRNWSGVYRTTDRGKTAQIVCRATMIGTQSSGGRNCRSNIQNDPGTGPEATVPELAGSRHIYFCQSVNDYGPYVRFWRSTNNGASFSKHGPELPFATYADGNTAIFGFRIARDGTMFMFGGKGAWKSTSFRSWGLNDDPGSLGLTSLTGSGKLPAGLICYDMEIVGSGSGSSIEVWGASDVSSKTTNDPDSGLFRSTNSGNTFTRKKTGKTKYFEVSPHNSNHMVCISRGQKYAALTTNGGDSWTDASNVNFWPGMGSPSAGGSDSSHPAPWHRREQGLIFLEAGNGFKLLVRNANTPSSATVREWGTDFEGTHIRGMGFHPTNNLRFAICNQDKILSYTEDGGISFINQGMGGTVLEPVVGAANAYQAVACVMGTENNRIACCAGQSNSTKTIMMIQNPQNGDGGNTIQPGKVNNAQGNPVNFTFSNGATSDGFNDPNDSNVVYMCGYRTDNFNTATMSDVRWKAMADGRLVFGVSNSGGNTYVWGATGDNTRNVYRSTNKGDDWTLFITLTDNARREAMCPDPNSANIMYAPGNDTHSVWRATNTYKVKIFDASDSSRPEYCPVEIDGAQGNHPDHRIAAIKVDYNDSNIMYCGFTHHNLSKAVFRTTNALGSWLKSAGPGDGTVTDLAVTANTAPYGEYTVNFSNATTYTVLKPDNSTLATGAVGSVFNSGGVTFRIVAGSTAFTSSTVLKIKPYPVWEDITSGTLSVPSTMYIHPKVGTMFWCGSHGPYIRKTPDGYNTKYSVSSAHDHWKLITDYRKVAI